MTKKLVLYLGTKGGGARLYRDIYQSWLNDDEPNDFMFLNKKNFEYDLCLRENKALKRIEFTNSKIRMMLDPLQRYTSLKRIVDTCKLNKIDTVVDVMPHYWSIGLASRLYKINIKYVPIIHDHKKHSGELWPTNKFIKKIMKLSVYSIFLNQNSSDFLQSSKNIVSTLQTVPFQIKINPNNEGKYFLFAGRIKAYKNFGNLIIFLQKLPPEINFLIMGAGKIPKKFLRKMGAFKNVKLNNSWVKFEEFEHAIANSSAIVLPYSEATQSGPAAIAMSYGVPVIFQPNQGLSLQLESYKNSIKIEDFEYSDFFRKYKRKKVSKLLKLKLYEDLKKLL